MCRSSTTIKIFKSILHLTLFDEDDVCAGL